MNLRLFAVFIIVLGVIIIGIGVWTYNEAPNPGYWIKQPGMSEEEVRDIGKSCDRLYAIAKEKINAGKKLMLLKISANMNHPKGRNRETRQKHIYCLTERTFM